MFDDAGRDGKARGESEVGVGVGRGGGMGWTIPEEGDVWPSGLQ